MKPFAQWTPPYTTAEPDITSIDLQPTDDFLVMASDGLFQVRWTGERRWRGGEARRREVAGRRKRTVTVRSTGSSEAEGEREMSGKG